jgi:hypothetical protein
MHLVLRLAGAVVMAIWLVGLVVFSTMLYQRDDLTADFGTYNQAWTLIGQGHLNPYDTVFIHAPFLKSDFELIMWPLALIHLVLPQPVVLLWIQDLAVATSGFVVYLWIADYLERRRVAWWAAAGVATVALMAIVANPGVYQTLLFDFHMEPLSTVFILLAGRDLWWGRHRRAWIWVAIAPLFGAFAAITIIGLGVSALLAGRDIRREGVLLVIAGVAWLGLISVVGANSGSGLDYYAYLAGRSRSGRPWHRMADVGVTGLGHTGERVVQPDRPADARFVVERRRTHQRSRAALPYPALDDVAGYAGTDNVADGIEGGIKVHVGDHREVPDPSRQFRERVVLVHVRGLFGHGRHRREP